MKKITLLLIMLFVSMGFVQAQDEQLDDMDFEEIPAVKESPTYFAIGAGYVGALNYINLNEINSKFKNDFNLPELSSPIYLSGVHGFTGIGIIPNLRLGFLGFSGSSEVSDNIDTIKHGSKLSASLMGFTLDYGFVLFKHFAILPGIQAGWSSLEQNYYETLNTSNSPNWNDLEPNSDGKYFSKNIKGSFVFVQPELSLEYALTPFLMTRAAVGYGFSFLPEWEYNSSADLKGVPDAINTGGLNLQFGVFVGLFNF